MFNEIQADIKILNHKIKELKEFGFKKAEAEERYRIELSKYLAEKILEGQKVSVLGDLARGDTKIANLRKDRDKWQIMYDTTLESIFSLKTSIRIMETQMKLEWGKRDDL